MNRLRRTAAAIITAVLLTLPAVAGAPAAGAATFDQGSDRAVVQGWYRNFLGRDADAGAQGWVDRLGYQAPGDVVWALAHTNEFNSNEVASYYNDYLGRAPDAGANYWVSGVNAGRFPVEWVQQNLLASPEYFRRYAYSGSSSAVDYWYLDVLGRLTQPGENAYWAQRIDRVGRLGALRELWYSDEAVRGRINDHYSNLLSRDADFSGLDYWYSKEVESDINVAVLIAATTEYRSKQYER